MSIMTMYRQLFCTGANWNICARGNQGNFFADGYQQGSCHPLTVFVLKMQWIVKNRSTPGYCITVVCSNHIMNVSFSGYYLYQYLIFQVLWVSGGLWKIMNLSPTMTSSPVTMVSLYLGLSRSLSVLLIYFSYLFLLFVSFIFQFFDVF